MSQNCNTAGCVNYLDAYFGLDMIFGHISRATAQQIFVKCFLKVFYVTLCLKISRKMRATENLVRRIGKALSQFGHVEPLLSKQIKNLESAGIA